MKRVSAILVLMAVLLLSCGTSDTQALDERWNELAQRVVNECAPVKPGDVVVISGGKHTVPFMERLSIEVDKKGALSIRFMESDKIWRSYYTDVPMEYLNQDFSFMGKWFEDMDYFIVLPDIEDPEAVLADVPEERFAKISESSEVFQDMLNASGLKILAVDYPTVAEAASEGLDFETYERLHWDAVNADYTEMSRKGNAIRDVFQGAERVRVTSSHGTDFTFDPGDRPILVNDGRITKEEGEEDLALLRYATLPSGHVVFAPVEASAEGRVVVPRLNYNYKPLSGVSFTFEKGRVTDFQAEEGAEVFEETLAPYAGPKDVFAIFQLGLNPALRVIEDGADFRPSNAAGVVYISVGFNRMLGGGNDTQGGFAFPIVGATVEVDGQVVVKGGKIVI